MSRRRFTNITADDIREAASFGRWGGDPVQTVCQGLVSIAGGFRTGHTVRLVLTDLGLIGRKSGELTKLGRRFLYDLACDRDFSFVLTGILSPPPETRSDQPPEPEIRLAGPID